MTWLVLERISFVTNYTWQSRADERCTIKFSLLHPVSPIEVEAKLYTHCVIKKNKSYMFIP